MPNPVTPPDDTGQHPAGGGNAAGPAGGAGGGAWNAPGGSGGSNTGPVYAPRFSCSPGAQSADAPLRRLSHDQFVGAINALVGAMAGADAAAVKSAIAVPLSAVPVDQYVSVINKGHDGFRRADQALTQLQMDAQFELAKAIGRELTRTPARVTALFGAAATDANAANDVAAVDAFVRAWGPRILRAPVTTDDVNFYRQALRGTVASAEALADVVALLFASPRVFFAVEETGTELGANALANRLSFHLWNEPPDDVLLQSVASGELTTPAGYAKQVDRLLGDPRAQKTFSEFAFEWFSLHRTADLSLGLRFPDYAALAGADRPTGASAAGMNDDVLGMVQSVFSRGAPARELLTDRHVFTRDAFVAKAYGVAPWDGVSAPPVPPSSARVGLITRPAFVALGDYSSHPILKGVRIRTSLLCDALGEAPPNAIVVAEGIKPTGPSTQRELAEVRTANASCAACHKLAINPLGFATENFDSLGRERATEKIHDAAGKLLAEKPVDTAVTPAITYDDTRTAAGAAGVVDYMVQSRKFEACLVSQYFRFTFHKVKEDPQSDGCLLAGLESLAGQGASIRDLMRAVVMSPEFKRHAPSSTP